MKEINIKHISNLHTDALRGLEFYEQELAIMQKRLEEIAGDNTGNEVAVNIEHFQNQFLIQNNNLDELKHKIKQNLKTIESQVMSSAGFVDQDSMSLNANLYDQYLTEEKTINDIRHEFNRFTSKWM
jgi:hypothetical protein